MRLPLPIRVSSLLALLANASCGDSECFPSPCPISVAVTVAVTSSATGAAISDAFVQRFPTSDSMPCNGTCNVLGGSGTYMLSVSAAGYQGQQRVVNVPAGNACGCSVKTQHLGVALVPTP